MGDYFSSVPASRNGPTTPVNGVQNPSGRMTPRTPRTPTSELPPATPSVRIRRLPSAQQIHQLQTTRDRARGQGEGAIQEDDPEGNNRRRSMSAPQRPLPAQLPSARTIRRQRTYEALSPLAENPPSRGDSYRSTQDLVPGQQQRAGRLRGASDAARRMFSSPRNTTSATQLRDHNEGNRSRPPTADYNQDIVDILDVLDPEVSTLTTLNNYQNSFYFPPAFSRYFNRTPTYDLSMDDGILSDTDSDQTPEEQRKQPSDEPREEVETPDLQLQEPGDDAPVKMRPLKRTTTLKSVLDTTEDGQDNYAVLPHGVRLDGWSDEDKDLLNDHVRHLMHSRKARFKRKMRAFGKYVRTPFGAFVTIYSFLITFWGAAWVIFIIGWISVGDRQAYFIEICDQILTALFAVVGIGLAPFRVVDTYHMIFVAKYHYKTWDKRREAALPDLKDPNDLPEPDSLDPDVEAEAAVDKREPDAVLTPEQQRKYLHHRSKFMKSHTFYKPHETSTHYAFSIKLLITVVVLLDFHSIFQICLGGTTWGINYHHRPKALTAVILTCSICCNIAGGITISIGDRKTRKKVVLEKMFRQALTEQSIKKLNKKKGLAIPAPIAEAA